MPFGRYFEELFLLKYDFHTVKGKKVGPIIHLMACFQASKLECKENKMNLMHTDIKEFFHY